jgi:hypothetical protein
MKEKVLHLLETFFEWLWVILQSIIVPANLHPHPHPPPPLLSPLQMMVKETSTIDYSGQNNM